MQQQTQTMPYTTPVEVNPPHPDPRIHFDPETLRNFGMPSGEVTVTYRAPEAHAALSPASSQGVMVRESAGPFRLGVAVLGIGFIGFALIQILPGKEKELKSTIARQNSAIVTQNELIAEQSQAIAQLKQSLAQVQAQQVQASADLQAAQSCMTAYLGKYQTQPVGGQP